jgi:hypothetical protein
MYLKSVQADPLIFSTKAFLAALAAGARSNKQKQSTLPRRMWRGEISMLTETITVERTACSLLPLDTLGGTIKAHIAAGDKATGKAEEHYKAAGLLLLEAKQRLPLESPGITWSAFLVGTCKIGTSRAYELIAIAEDRTSVAEVQAKGRERAARHAAKNKVARSSVSNGQSVHKIWLDRVAKKTVDADSMDLEVIEQFITARMSQRNAGALN